MALDVKSEPSSPQLMLYRGHLRARRLIQDGLYTCQVKFSSPHLDLGLQCPMIVFKSSAAKISSLQKRKIANGAHLSWLPFLIPVFIEDISPSFQTSAAGVNSRGTSEKMNNPSEYKITRKRKKRNEPAKVKNYQQQTEFFTDALVKEQPEAISSKRRRRRKKISDVLANSAPVPATPTDLQKMIIQYFKSERSVIELEELKIPDSCFLQHNDLSHTPSSYLKQVCPKWAKLSKNHTKNKSILMLILCSSALRALEMIRLIATFKGNCKTLKLFAKHIKIEEQIKWLAKGIAHIGVGTPGRIRNLIDCDELSLQSLKYVIFDWNWRDQKLRRLMDIPEVKKETLKLLETSIIPVLKSGSVKLGFF